MPAAIPLHLPTVEELERAHETYRAREQRDYAYWVARLMLTEESGGFRQSEAIDLLLRIWNSQSPYTWRLTLEATDELLAATASSRDSFAERGIAELTEEDRPAVTEIFGKFRNRLGPVGAAKALALLHVDFFPLWDGAIAKAHCGWNWNDPAKVADRYFTFMSYCAEQCGAVTAEGGLERPLLKTLDEWNYSIWTHGWLPEPSSP